MKFSLLCCAEVIQNYDLQHLPTHRVATLGSRPPNLSFSAYHRLLQDHIHVLSGCTARQGAFQPTAFAIIKDWLWLKSCK